MMDRRKIIGKRMVQWFCLVTIVGLGSGTLSAFFLKSLAFVTRIRIENQWLYLFLPVGGMIFAFLYQHYGKNAGQGNNLIINQANGGNEKIYLRMIPLTLFGTIMTHLFGGSVGREGTAVQMGGAVAEAAGQLVDLNKREREQLIICGISGGFSSVFGTPFAGTLFAIEVVAIGKMRWDALIPCFATGMIANLVATLWGAHHTYYPLGEIPPDSLGLWVKIVGMGIIFGGVAMLFSYSIRWIKSLYAKIISNPVIRNGVGGLVVLLGVSIAGTTRYMGLSLPLLTDAFAGHTYPFDFINKLLFTVFSLGAGYQGGEVTPLFEIGATLGSSLAPLLNIPVGFLAALGFVAVFSGATNTPFACCVMGMELFGLEMGGYMLVVCWISYLFSGKRGIYSAQINTRKKGQFHGKRIGSRGLRKKEY